MFLKKFRKKAKVTIGAVERVSLPELGIKNLKVRVDTGAALSALHAENIRYKRSKTGQRFVYFDIVIGQKGDFTYIPARAQVHYIKKFLSSNGLKTKRPVIETKSWTAHISLISRSSMEYRMLLGRNSLRDKFLVDVGHKFIA